MWYRIDFTKLVTHLLPPILRSRFLTALMGAMILPLRYIYGQFHDLKEDVENRLNITANMQYLEKALNDAFFLHDRQIYIMTPEEKAEEYVRPFYFTSERQQPHHFYLEEEENVNNFFLYYSNESNSLSNFIVMVPTFLCTSTRAREDDRYEWEYLRMIKNILKTHKPAGRTFGIELYDYE